MGAFSISSCSVSSIFVANKIKNVNKLSPILNVVLLIAVAVLYFLHFSGSGATDKTAGSKNDSLAKTINTTQAQKESKIVYLNIDSLFVKYEYYKKVNDDANTILKTQEYNYQKRVNDLQVKYQDYMEKAGAGLIPKAEAEKIEAEITAEKQRLDELSVKRERWQDEAMQKVIPVQKELYDFFKQFTKANGYSCILTYTLKCEGALGINDNLDVTNQVIKGLNDKYHEDLKSGKLKK